MDFYITDMFCGKTRGRTFEDMVGRVNKAVSKAVAKFRNAFGCELTVVVTPCPDTEQINIEATGPQTDDWKCYSKMLCAFIRIMNEV